jgi:hypothetical protein
MRATADQSGWSTTPPVRSQELHTPAICSLEDLGFVPAARPAPPPPTATPPRRQTAVKRERRRPLLHAFRPVRHVRASRKRAPNARHRPRPDPRRQDLGLPRCRRDVRRLRHDYNVEQGTLTGKGDEMARYRLAESFGGIPLGIGGSVGLYELAPMRATNGRI